MKGEVGLSHLQQHLFLGNYAQPVNLDLNILHSKMKNSIPQLPASSENNFYVDDGLICVESVETTIKLVREAK